MIHPGRGFFLSSLASAGSVPATRPRAVRDFSRNPRGAGVPSGTLGVSEKDYRFIWMASAIISSAVVMIRDEAE